MLTQYFYCDIVVGEYTKFVRVKIMGRRPMNNLQHKIFNNYALRHLQTAFDSDKIHVKRIIESNNENPVYTETKIELDLVLEFKNGERKANIVSVTEY